MNRTGIWRQVLTALIVGIGVGIVWGVAAGWGVTLAELYSQPSVYTYEEIIVSDQGTPLIQTTAQSAVDYEITYRTLDGRPATVKRHSDLIAAYLDGPTRPPGLFQWPITWSGRLGSISFHGRPPVGWYVVRDAQPHGYGYFVGYDAQSKLRVGYIGREGFRPSLPPRDERFDLGTRWSMEHGVCSTGFLQLGAAAYYYLGDGGASMSQRLVFLLDGDRLQQVDLQARAVRTLYQSPAMVSVAILRETLDAAPGGTEEMKTASRLALRTTDRIVVLDPTTAEKREYTLPESVGGEGFTAYPIGDQQLLLECRDWRRSLVRFSWLDRDDTVSRQQTVALTRYAGFSPRVETAMEAVVAPVPIGWVLLAGIVVPLRKVQVNEQPSYAAAFRDTLDEGWPAMLGVCLLGGVLTWPVVRLQRKYWRPHTGIWAAFVLLFGPAALVAYWVEQRRPKLEPCGQCGRIVPRDRGECAACGTVFPAPPPVGTEIFA